MLAFLGLFKTCFCTYASPAPSPPLSDYQPVQLSNEISWISVRHLPGTQYEHKASGSLAYYVLIVLRLMASVSSDLVCLCLSRCFSLSLCLSLYFPFLLSVSISAPVLAHCSASVSRLVSFFMSSVRQMSNGVACSDITWRTIRICLPYIPYTTFIAISMCPARATEGRSPRYFCAADKINCQLAFAVSFIGERATS